MSDNRAHARLSASGAYIWLNCTMSPLLSEGIARKSSKWADEGTQAHAFAEAKLRDEPTEENKDFDKWTKIYVDYVNALIATTPFHSIEKRVSLAPLWEKDGETPPEKMFGTADFVALTPDRVLHVVDLKYGAGVPVEPNSPQLFYYGLGTVLSLPDSIAMPEAVCLTIVQPRAAHPDGPIRHHTLPTVDLLHWGYSTLKPTVELIAEGDVSKLSVVVGSHCRWCPAASVSCPVKHKTKVASARQEFDAVE